MSQYETDREEMAVGPELCDECDHPLRLHGPDGCQFERGDRWVNGESMGAWMAMGPCGCSGCVATVEEMSIAEAEQRWPGSTESFAAAQARLARVLNRMADRLKPHVETKP